MARAFGFASRRPGTRGIDLTLHETFMSLAVYRSSGASSHGQDHQLELRTGMHSAPHRFGRHVQMNLGSIMSPFLIQEYLRHTPGRALISRLASIGPINFLVSGCSDL